MLKAGVPEKAFETILRHIRLVVAVDLLLTGPLHAHQANHRLHASAIQPARDEVSHQCSFALFF